MNINEFEEKYVTVITPERSVPKKVIESGNNVLWEDIPSDRKVYKMKPANEYPVRSPTPFPEIIRTNIIFVYSPEGYDTVIIPASLDQMFVSEYNEFFNQITSL